MNDSRQRGCDRKPARERGRTPFDPLRLLFPNAVAGLVLGVALPVVLVVLILVIALAGLLRQPIGAESGGSIRRAAARCRRTRTAPMRTMDR